MPEKLPKPEVRLRTSTLKKIVSALGLNTEQLQA